MKQRILSALVFVPVLLIFMYLGGAPFAALVAVLATIGVHEFCAMAKTKHQVLFVPILLGVWVMLACSYFHVSNSFQYLTTSLYTILILKSSKII